MEANLPTLIESPPQQFWLVELVAREMQRAFSRMTTGESSGESGRIETLSAAPQAEWNRVFLPDHFQLPSSTLHTWLNHWCDSMRSTRGQKINLIGPRDTAKSTIATLAYPLRCAVENWEPLIWILSETRGQAVGHLENLKVEIEANELLAQAFPRATGRGSVWRADRIRLRNGVEIQAYGVGQKIRGRRSRANRPSLIICDDLQSDAASLSPNLRAKNRDWFHGTVMKAGSQRTNFINLANAIHRDAIGCSLQRSPGWRSHVFASVIEWPKRMDLWEKWSAIYGAVEDQEHQAKAMAFFEANRTAMLDGAVVLWPERESLYQLMAMREESGRTAFEREKQSKPINPDTCEWPDAEFGDHAWFETWPANLIYRGLALDPSKGAHDKRGDYSAFVKIGIDNRGIIYVQGNLARRPPSQIVQDGVAIYLQFQPHGFVLESNQWQDLLQPDFEEEFQRQRIVAPAVYCIDNRVNKRVRIRRLGGYLASKRLRFKSNCDSTRLLVEQMRDFPVGDHDDGPDALELAIQLAERQLNVEQGEKLSGTIS